MSTSGADWESGGRGRKFRWFFNPPSRPSAPAGSPEPRGWRGLRRSLPQFRAGARIDLAPRPPLFLRAESWRLGFRLRPEIIPDTGMRRQCLVREPPPDRETSGRVHGGTKARETSVTSVERRTRVSLRAPGYSEDRPHRAFPLRLSSGRDVCCRSFSPARPLPAHEVPIPRS